LLHTSTGRHEEPGNTNCGYTYGYNLIRLAAK